MWNYYRDEPSNPLSSNSESFKYKKSITGNTYNLVAGDADYDATIEIENYWNCCTIETFEQFLENSEYTINCEIELIFTWSENCVLVNTIPAITAPTGLEFQTTDTKLYVQVFTLSTENIKKL